MNEARFENEATKMVRDAVKNIKDHLRAYNGEPRIKPRFGSLESPLESIVYDKKYFGGLPDRLADQGITKVTFSMKVEPSTAFGEGKKFEITGKTIRYDDDDPRTGEITRERQVVVGVALSDEFRMNDMSRLVEKMKDTAVHELTHGGQSTDVLKKSGAAQMKAFQHGLTSIEALRLYYLDPAETEAYARGLYKRAKMSKVPYTTKLDEQIDDLLDFYNHPKTLEMKDTQYTEEEVNDFFRNEYRQSLIDYAKENLPAAVIEGLLKEEAKGLSGIGIYLADNFIILYDAKGIDANMYDFTYTDPDEHNIEKYIVGVVRMGFREGHLTVEEIWAEKGYGPVLYRLAIEQSGRIGITPSRLRGEVSDSASRVWKEFYDGKGFVYVRHEPLDKKVHDVEWLDSAYYLDGERVNKAEGVGTHEKIFEDDPYDELETNLIETADALLREKMEEIGY